MWSIPHFLFGVIFSFLPEILTVSVRDVFLVMLVLALLWEVYEKFIEIKETVWNSIIDILMPVLAFFLTRLVINNLQKIQVQI